MVDQLLSAFGNRMFIMNPYRYAGPTFTPPDIPGLELWYDSSDTSTLWQDDGRTTQVTATGQDVGAWDDKSGNGGHAKQGTAGNRPIYRGSNGIQFEDTNSEYLTNTIYLPAFGVTSVFVVFRLPANPTPNSDCFYSVADDTQSTQYFNIVGLTSGAIASTMRNPTPDNLITTATTFGDNATHIINHIEISTTSRELRVDGAHLVTSSTNVSHTMTPNNVSLGRHKDNTPDNYLDGYLMEIAVYDSALGTTDRQTFENYAIAKWGI